MFLAAVINSEIEIFKIWQQSNWSIFSLQVLDDQELELVFAVLLSEHMELIVDAISFI